MHLDEVEVRISLLFHPLYIDVHVQPPLPSMKEMKKLIKKSISFINIQFKRIHHLTKVLFC